MATLSLITKSGGEIDLFTNLPAKQDAARLPRDKLVIGTSTRVECCDCHAREVVRFNELEFAVLCANDHLMRLCSGCGSVTRWHLADDGVTRRTAVSCLPPPQPGRGHSETAPLAEGADADSPQPQRMYPRVRVNMKACISKPGSDDDIVHTMNVSRGGVAVRSERVYATESWIQVAVPYTPAAANIFVPARIVWRGDLEGTHQYGIKYIRS